MGRPRIFISAMEPSADRHGANLVRSLRRLAPEAEIWGLGGPAMRQAGAELVADTAGFGIIGVMPLFAAAGRYLNLLSRIDRELGRRSPDAAVTIDCPGFHFLLGSRLRARGVPALWYIPPQLWAWAPWRARKLARRFAAVACILPHEEAFFRERGVPATYVGNPVVDGLRNLPLDQAFLRSLRITARDRLVLLMPGSRRQEVGPILRRQLRIARALAERHGHCSFVLALADEKHRAWAAPALGESGLAIRTVVGKTHEVQSAADLALAKSGTTTLELAFYGTPLIVFYNISPTQWHLAGRWMVTTPFLSLPNAVAGRAIVKEFMYTGASETAMIEEASALLTDERRRSQMKADLADVRRRIDLPGTSDRAAREVLALVGRQAPPPPWYRWGLNL